MTTSDETAAPDPDNLPVNPDVPEDPPEVSPGGDEGERVSAPGGVDESDQAVPSELPDQDQTDDGGLLGDAGSVPTGNPVREVRQPFGQV